MNSLTPELLELLNSGSERRHRFGSGSSCGSSSGGFIPYSTYVRRSQNLGNTLSPPVSGSTSLHVQDTAHWVSRHQVGAPEKTAWLINDRGNKVWFTYETTPSLFPVKETRFYKPKLHRKDFLGKKKKDEE